MLRMMPMSNMKRNCVPCSICWRNFYSLGYLEQSMLVQGYILHIFACKKNKTEKSSFMKIEDCVHARVASMCLIDSKPNHP